MFTFGFYNSINHDRVYDATQFGSIFDGVISDGVYMNIGEFLATVPGTGFQVIVKTGRAWFDHTWSLNDSYLPLDLDQPDVIQTRIDAVVLEVDTRVETRANSIKIVKGIPSVNPVRPTLLNTGGVFQHPLAYVTLKPAATAILAEDIELVVGKDECPFVSSPLKTISVTDLFNNWDGQFNTWFDNLKAQLSDNVVTNLQNQIDEKVNIKDKATEEDIKNEAPGKWIDAEGLASFGRYFALTPGQIMQSPDANLEEMFPGEFMACDQRIVTDPDLVAELKKYYFRPPDFVHAKDVTVGKTTIQSSYSQYYMPDYNAHAPYDLISCEWEDEVFFFTGTTSHSILILNKKTNEIKKINLNSALSNYFTTYVGVIVKWGYIFMFGTNFVVARVRIGSYSSVSAITLAPPAKDAIGTNHCITSFIHGSRIGYIVVRANGSNSWVYVCYSENLFESVVEKNFPITASTFSFINYGRDTNADGPFTRPIQKYKDDYYAVFVINSVHALYKISVYPSVSVTKMFDFNLNTFKDSYGFTTSLTVIDSKVSVPFGIVNDIFYIYCVGDKSVNTPNSSVPVTVFLPGVVKVPFSNMTPKFIMPDYGGFVNDVAHITSGNTTMTAIPNKLPNIMVGTANSASCVCPIGLVWDGSEPALLWGDLGIVTLGFGTYIYPRYNTFIAISDFEFTKYRVLDIDGQNVDMKLKSGNHACKVYDDFIMLVTTNTYNSSFFNVYDDLENMELTYRSERSHSSRRMRNVMNNNIGAADSYEKYTVFVIDRHDPEQRHVVLKVPYNTFSTTRRPVYSNGRLYNISDYALMYTDFNQLVLPYEPDSYIRLPKPKE